MDQLERLSVMRQSRSRVANVQSFLRWLHTHFRTGGQSVAHIVGFFPDNAPTATFDETLMPFVEPVSLKLEKERDERVSGFSRTLSYLDQGANPTLQ